MLPHPKRRSGWILWGLCGLVAVFLGLTIVRPELTGNDEVNGLSGVFLGLFIAAFPAANFLDMLLFEGTGRRWRTLGRADLRWIAFNLFVLLAGLIVVVVGTQLFFKHWRPG